MVDIINKYLNKYSDYENPNFNKEKEIYNWKNYVLNDWQENWNMFSKQEKQIIYIMAEARGDSLWKFRNQ